jgi:hypothetical protein
MGGLSLGRNRLDVLAEDAAGNPITATRVVTWIAEPVLITTTIRTPTTPCSA